LRTLFSVCRRSRNMAYGNRVEDVVRSVHAGLLAVEGGVGPGPTTEAVLPRALLRRASSSVILACRASNSSTEGGGVLTSTLSPITEATYRQALVALAFVFLASTASLMSLEMILFHVLQLKLGKIASPSSKPIHFYTTCVMRVVRPHRVELFILFIIYYHSIVRKLILISWKA
jgi:hypothetical protein